MHAQAGLVSSLSVSRPHKVCKIIIIIIEAIRSGDLGHSGSVMSTNVFH